VTTLQHAWQAARQTLLPLESATLDAQLLLARVLNVERTYLLAHGDVELQPHELATYERWISRRAKGEPYAYLIGEQAFYDLVLKVTPDVLIPRSETELLVEQAIAHAQTLEHPIIADIGTGSGAIAVTVAQHVPHATVYAVDISEAALQVAQENAKRNHVNVHFLQGSLATPLIEQGVRVDLLLANLPYIATDEMHTLEVSQHEPHLALDGGHDGLDLVRDLLAQAPQVCQPHALILLEIGSGQGDATLEAAASLQPQHASVMKDYAGHERVVQIVMGA
jgi:release factor glutamine methyltransferase